ncbi:hypothetical protein HMPREF9696_01123 [Afipia clevelandensis ATCC 49720]|uniref:Autotransporter domain-containing protein n=1 Tax=Afipia clevelandensis ATCC 49720 TaxID=883079 RepID=K8PD41_9BRAD|nr:hypothetical protein HMPREF9696_01123 [Afipia clevelandensis ATCC 49720]
MAFFCVRKARAPRFLFALAIFSFVSFAAITNARAQFGCVGAIGASDVTCTNTGTETAVPYMLNQTGVFNLTINSSGVSNGITATTVDGNNLVNNSGTGNSGISLFVSGNGNAVLNNSGSAFALDSTASNGNSTIANSALIFAITNNAQNGKALTQNSGQILNNISTSSLGGDATTINSGNIQNLFGPTAGIVTSTNLGGNASTINSGAVAGGIQTYTDALGGDALSVNTSTGNITGGITTATGFVSFGIGNATTINAGTADFLQTYTVVGGNAVSINTGTLINPTGNPYPSFLGPGYESAMLTFAIGTTGDAIAINRGTIADNANNPSILTISDTGNASTTNYGTTGGIYTISGYNGGSGDASIVNYGTVTTGIAAIAAGDGNASVYNAGSSIGGVTAQAYGFGSATVTNAGLVDGRNASGGIAISLSQFSIATPTTLNILPGSRILGMIDLNGSSFFAGTGTQINILGGHDISSVLTFGGGCVCGGGLLDTGSVVNVTGGAPYVIKGDTVALLDPTSFANAERNVVDVTRTITSLVTSRLTNPAPINGNGSAVMGFAPSGNVARDMANDVFSGIPALAYASNDRVLLSNPSFTAADGTSIWAQGFGGQRIQQASAPTLRSVNNFYGGVLGIDKTVQPGLRLGGFIGGGAIKSSIDLNSGSTSSDIGFGGVYGRYAMGRAFLDFSLLGGYSSNDVKRTLTNNLAPGGYEYASGKYDGWFVSPEVAYGFQRALGYNLTLTPSARVRYLAAGFGGYQESGSSANLTVASRVSHNFEERGELKLTHTTQATPSEQLQVSGTVGLVALQRASDSNVNTVLLGQSLAFATPGRGSIVGFYAGAGFDWRNASGVSVFGATEFTAMSDQSQTITGRGGVKVAF